MEPHTIMKTTAHAPALSLLNLTIEPAADGQSVSLEQDLGGDIHRVSLHSSQVRAVVDALELNWPETDRLKRALLRANGLADRLHKHLVTMDGMGHEDLTMEVMEALALADFLSFQCAEFADDYEAIPRTSLATAENPATAPRAAPVVPAKRTPAPLPPAASVPPRATSQGGAGSGELFQGAQS